MRTITFHFDYVSPYAYLAWTQIHALAARHGATVQPVPTLCGDDPVTKGVVDQFRRLGASATRKR